MSATPDKTVDEPVAIIDIGNTTVSLASWYDGNVAAAASASASSATEFDKAFSALLTTFPNESPSAVVVSSVNPGVLDEVRDKVESKLDRQALVIGEQIPLPMDVGVRDARAIGVDRVCAAAAAFDRLHSDCIVIDFGSAVTVDLVDEEGTLLGGAILPGLRMQFAALHEHSALLPEVSPAMTELAYGRDTTEAIQSGVCRGLAGAVRALVEAYAASLNKWPQVIATGGDLDFMAPNCDFLDSLVADLTLRGIGLAHTKYLASKGA